MKTECPICKQEIQKENEETNLCSSCDDNRFYNDDEREIQYRSIVQIRVEELKKLFNTDYNENLHTDMVEQIVRCEIAIHKYEQLIANDEESMTTSEYLKSERAHWNKLAEKLHMTIKSFRGDINIHKHELSGDFKTYFAQMLGDMDKKKQQ